MTNLEGKIIAVVGAAGTGKSYLTRKLAENYQAIPYYEGEAKDFPERVKENFDKRTRFFETIIWFRNQQVQQYMQALELKKEGKCVVMDTFWLTNQLHISPYLEDDFERETALQLAELDRQILSWPDIIVYIDSSEESMRNYMKNRFGERYWEREDFVRLMLAVNEEHKRFFDKNRQMKNLIVINRENTDFEREEDFNKLLQEISERMV